MGLLLTKPKIWVAIADVSLFGLLVGVLLLQKVIEPSSSALSCSEGASGELGVVPGEELESQGLTNVGTLFALACCPLLVSNRSDRAIVEVPSGTGMLLPPGKVRGGIQDFRFGFGGEEFRVSVTIPVGQDWPDVIHQKGEGFPRVIRQPDSLVLEGTNQAFTLVLLARGLNSGSLRLALASDGDFFVEELVGSTIIDEWTGEVIEPSSMQGVGSLEDTGRASDFFFTSCDQNTSVCHVVFREIGGEIRTPAEGNLRCLAGDELSFDDQGKPIGEFELDLDSFVLRLREAYATSPNTNTSWECQTREVASGDVISKHNHFSLWAFRYDGSPLSIAVSQGGSLHVGDVSLRLGCPCIAGS